MIGICTNEKIKAFIGIYTTGTLMQTFFDGRIFADIELHMLNTFI